MCGMETGAKRANVAVALAEADRARIVLANNDRIAGTPPVEVPSAGLVKAIYLRAQCLVRCSCVILCIASIVLADWRRPVLRGC